MSLLRVKGLNRNYLSGLHKLVEEAVIAALIRNKPKMESKMESRSPSPTLNPGMLKPSSSPSPSISNAAGLSNDAVSVEHLEN